VSGPSSADLLACAVEGVRRAAAHALANEHRRGEMVSSTQHDVKLALDHECQRVIEGVIRGAFPSHAILGEEGETEGDAGSILWIVDPIDGTVNFSHGIPYWCHSVAVQRDGRTVAAAVYAPVYRELFEAREDAAATLNGAPIRVSATPTLARSLMLTGLEKNFDQHSQSVEVARAVAVSVQKMRLLGAAALDLCQIACGRADGFYESGLNIWDVAAAELICQQAGGRTLNLAQLTKTKFRYIASNGLIHDELLALLAPFESWMAGR
jgi:myo-inositol-1(or 4)-monophosphatase